MKATVLYYSHTGRTAAYAREIAMYLWSKGLDVSLSSISDFDKQRLLKSDIVLSGCWTCGWFVMDSIRIGSGLTSASLLQVLLMNVRSCFLLPTR